MKDILQALFSGNDLNVEKVGASSNEVLASMQEGQQPSYVTVCCSDSRVSNEAAFDHTSPGINFTIGEIGNKVVSFDAEGQRQISGSVSYIPSNQKPDAIVVLGHTGCGAITAVYDYMTGDDLEEQPKGVRDIAIDLLHPELEAYRDRLPDDRTLAINHLVEYNVDHQIRHLYESDDIPDDIPLIGMVYDLHEAYDDCVGTVYLVNLNGLRAPSGLAEACPDPFAHRAKRLTHEYVIE